MTYSANSRNRILIVEDDVASRSLLSSYLSQEGYDVLETGQADNLCRTVEEENIDLVLLDIKLPGKDGLTLTRELRAASTTGIILVTSKGDDIDRIVGLELGADDYVTKPFNPRELLVRAKNLLWRVKESQELRHTEIKTSKKWNFEGWVLDGTKRLLISPGNIHERLPEAEFKLLSSLLNEPRSILSRDQLMKAIHEREWTPNDRSIDIMIGRLRKKLGDNPSDPHFILTAHGMGYMFSGEVS
jgi:DNA-binding response OmpR family regulator